MRVAYIFILLFLSSLSCALSTVPPADFPYADNLKKQKTKNDLLIRQGRLLETDFLTGHPKFLSKFSANAKDQANELLREFNTTYQLDIYFNFGFTIVAEETTTDDQFLASLTASGIAKYAGVTGAVVQIREEYILTNSGQSIDKSVKIDLGVSDGYKDCMNFLLDEIKDNPTSFSNSPDQALIAYVKAAIAGITKCLETNDSTDPNLQAFQYVWAFGTDALTRLDPEPGNNRLAETITPATSARKVFDYAGILGSQASLLEQHLTTSFGGELEGIPIRYYTTDNQTSQALFNGVKEVNPDADGFLIWNHLDRTTGKVYTRVSLGQALAEKLEQVGVSAQSFVQKLWTTFKEVANDPSTVFNGQNTHVKAVLLTNPFSQGVICSYWTAQILVQLLKYAEIPPSIYDPYDPNYYPIMYSIVLPQYQEQFAFLCGLINGLNSELRGIPELVTLLIGYFVDDEKGEQIDQMFATIKQEGFISLWKQNLNLAYGGSTCRIAHQVGRDVLGVATIFFGGVGIATKAGKVSLITKFVNPVRGMYSAILRFGKFAKRIGDSIVEIACSGIRIRIEKAITQGLEPYIVRYFNAADGSLVQNPDQYLPDEFNSYDLDWTEYYLDNRFPDGNGGYYPISEVFDFAEGFENVPGKLLRVADGSSDGSLKYIGKDHIDRMNGILQSIQDYRAVWSTLADLPKTARKNYELWRRVRIDWEPAVTHPNQRLQEVNRFSAKREAVYFGRSKEMANTEWLTYNKAFGLRGERGSKLYKFEVEEEGLLDLTDETILQRLQITKADITKPNDKLLPQALGEWAYERGYKGVIFPSARANGENLVIFKYFSTNAPPSIQTTELIETIL